jgi:L-ascorbate metabolism protein UlaG (beta-lactamase superfamily)
VKYKNLDGSTPHTLGNVVKWVMNRKRDTRAFVTPRVENDGAALRQNSSEPWLTWIGHATWLVQLGGKNVLIDPIWAKAISGVIPRKSDPGVRIEDLPRIDAVLVSHNHRDHMDAPTLKRFTSAEAIVPLGLAPAMKKIGYTRVVELDWWQSHALGDVTVHFVPSQHWSRRGLNDSNDTLWGGFVIAGGGKKVYHSGDTAYFDGFKTIGERLGPIDIALLPIGAYEPEWFMRKQHMNPEDALHAFRDLRAGRMLAMHWGTYQLTDEWLGEPPLALQRLLTGAADASRVQVVRIGETIKS